MHCLQYKNVFYICFNGEENVQNLLKKRWEHSFGACTVLGWRVRQMSVVGGLKTAKPNLFLTASTWCFPVKLRKWMTL